MNLVRIGRGRGWGGTVKDWKLSDWIWGTSEEEERRVSRIASCLGGFCTDWRRRRRRRRGGREWRWHVRVPVASRNIEGVAEWQGHG